MFLQGFGDDASKKSKKKTGMITSALENYSEGDGKYAKHAGMASEMMGKLGLVRPCFCSLLIILVTFGFCVEGSMLWGPRMCACSLPCISAAALCSAW